MTDLRVALVTTLNDRLVAPLRRTVSEVENGLRGVERRLRDVSATGRDADRVLSGMRGPDRASREVASLARNTDNALNLAQRLQGVWSRSGNIARGLGAGIAAGQAVRYVMSEPLRNERTYGRSLADAANVAFADRDLAGRQGGMRELDSMVVRAMREGGGKREAVVSALNDMLASGTVKVDTAGSDLSILTKYSTAGNADIGSLATIATRARQNNLTDTTRTLDMALAAGQEGGFELKDMAKWIPQFMANSKGSGLTGYEGYARILASAQASVITAGTRDEAGNNLVNLLAKISAMDTARDVKIHGYDLAGSLAAAKARGTNGLDAFVNLVDKIAAKDSRLVKLRQQAAAAGTDEDKRESLSAQADILQGSAIGTVIQDRQAMMALVAELNNRQYVKDVQRTIMGANGKFGADNFALVASTNDFKISQQENENLIAQTDVLGGANTALGTLAGVATDLYRRYPGYASVVEGAKLAISGLTAAAAGAAGVLALMGLARGAAAGGAAAAGAAGAATAAPRAGVILDKFGRPFASTLAASEVAAPAVAASGSLALPIAAAAGAAALVGAPVLAAGGAIQHQMTGTASGLRNRIADRDARLAEYADLISLERNGGGTSKTIQRLELERDNLQKDRDTMAQKLDELTLAILERPLQVNIDGREVQSSVNSNNARDGRRE